MVKKDKLDRMLVLLYRSNNAHGYTNFARPIDWMDKLPMVGLDELSAMFENMRRDVLREIEQRKADGIPKFSRAYHESQEEERAAGAALLSQIGVSSKEGQTDGS